MRLVRLVRFVRLVKLVKFVRFVKVVRLVRFVKLVILMMCVRNLLRVDLFDFEFVAIGLHCLLFIMVKKIIMLVHFSAFI